jgi:hypothetical protein
MKKPTPVRPATRIHSTSREWLPATFDDFALEIEGLKAAAAATKSLLLFRGHRQREWRLDSTFTRSIKQKLFGMNAEDAFSERLRNSGDLNLALSSLLLFKYGTMFEPSAELKQVEDDHGVDAWFELMKRHQQYQEEDSTVLQGTNFLDWSKNSDIALFFANEVRTGNGAVFVCDATATGKTLQILPVIEILNKVRVQLIQGQSNGAPLLFSPPKQILNQRAKNQQAVYFAQMEMRVDMLEIWRLSQSNVPDETICIKVVLPKGTEFETQEYLVKRTIDKNFIYPDA